MNARLNAENESQIKIIKSIAWCKGTEENNKVKK